MIKRVIALGFFDGVHRGHGALLRRVAQRAEELGAVPAALTFGTHPTAAILGRSIPLINTPAERAELMRRLYGIQEVLCLPFDGDIMRMDWADFITECLVGKYGAVHVVAGHDFHFGYRGEGCPKKLRQKCAQLGVGCDIIDKVEVEGITVSSTYIRTLIAQGEMERAALFLGHPHMITGTVVRGKQLGRVLGFPTANLLLPPEALSPAFGVYASRVYVGERDYPAVTNVGVRPTVDDGDQVTVEPWILDFDGDLYGQTIQVDFYRHLRGERRFSGLEELADTVRKNALETLEYFGEAPDLGKKGG